MYILWVNIEWMSWWMSQNSRWCKWTSKYNAVYSSYDAHDNPVPVHVYLCLFTSDWLRGIHKVDNPSGLCRDCVLGTFSTLKSGMSPIPTFGNRARAALSCIGGRNAGSYGCNWQVQCKPHTQCSVYIDSYWFLRVISNVIITCTYHFTIGDNHLQKSTILSSVICRYTCHQQTWYQPKFDKLIFVWKIDRQIIKKLCVIRQLCQASAHNTSYIIWSVIFT